MRRLHDGFVSTEWQNRMLKDQLQLYLDKLQSCQVDNRQRSSYTVDSTTRLKQTSIITDNAVCMVACSIRRYSKWLPLVYTCYVSKGYYMLKFTQGKKSQFWSCLFLPWPISALPVFPLRFYCTCLFPRGEEQKILKHSGTPPLYPSMSKFGWVEFAAIQKSRIVLSCWT